MVLLMVEVDCEVVLSPVVLALLFPIQVYDEATLLVSGIFTVPPLQIVAVLALVIAGTGFIVTVTCCTGPGQEPVDEVGVTVYTTVSTAVPVLVMVLLMVEPDCVVVLSPVVFTLLLPIHV